MAQPAPDPAGAGPAAADAARRARAAPLAAETRRLYAADWADFAAWCGRRRCAALPAAPATLAAYLGARAATLKHGALARRAAAIADRHRRAGLPPPGADPAVRAVLRAARIAAGAAARSAPSAPGALRARPARRRSPGPAQLTRMAARCPGDLAGLRDRALLLLAAAGLDGARLLALDREHVRLTGRGVELAVRGQAGWDRLELARGAAAAACPARALEQWLDDSDTRFGPVFRKVDRWGGVDHGRLRPDGLRRILRRRADAAASAARPSRRAPGAAA